MWIFCYSLICIVNNIKLMWLNVQSYLQSFDSLKVLGHSKMAICVMILVFVLSYCNSDTDTLASRMILIFIFLCHL